jgi:hypothetical protein
VSEMRTYRTALAVLADCLLSRLPLFLSTQTSPGDRTSITATALFFSTVARENTAVTSRACPHRAGRKRRDHEPRTRDG